MWGVQKSSKMGFVEKDLACFMIAMKKIAYQSRFFLLVLTFSFLYLRLECCGGTYTVCEMHNRIEN